MPSIAKVPELSSQCGPCRCDPRVGTWDLKGSHRFTSLHLAPLAGWDLYKCNVAESVGFVQAGRQEAPSFVLFFLFIFPFKPLVVLLSLCKTVRAAEFTAVLQVLVRALSSRTLNQFSRRSFSVGATQRLTNIHIWVFYFEETALNLWISPQSAVSKYLICKKLFGWVKSWSQWEFCHQLQ